jgi:hypothetical protein
MDSNQYPIGSKVEVTFLKLGEEKHLLRMTPEEVEALIATDVARRIKGEVVEVKGLQVIMKTWQGFRSFRTDRVLEVKIS